MLTVSVVIPTYKNRGGLINSIDSVLNQNSPNIIEIIIVDDNEPESLERKSTENLMKKYEGNLLVRYLKHEHNKNGAAARNTGIFSSKGDLVAFLDDDDIFLPHKIEKQVSFLEDNNQYDAVYCFERKQGVKTDTTIHQGNATCDILLLKSNFQTSTLVFRRHVLIALNGFDESFTRHQDVEIMLRFYQENFKLGCVPDVLVEMGKNNGENIPKGDKLEKLKSSFFDKFMSQIEAQDRIQPGFKNLNYATLL